MRTPKREDKTFSPEPQEPVESRIPEQEQDTTRPTAVSRETEIVRGPKRDTAVDQLSRRVRQVETKGRSTQSVALYRDYAAPRAPEILRYGTEAVCDCFRFTWTVERDPKVIGYNIYRSESPDNPYIPERRDFISQPSDPATAYLSWHETTLGRQYFYWVSTVNAGGVESPRILVQKTTSITGWVVMLDAATLVADAKLGYKFTATITATRMLGNVLNPFDGQQFVFAIIEDSTGGWDLTYDTKYNFGDSAAPTLNTGSKKGNLLSFIYWQATDKFWYVGSGTGYLGAL